MDLTLVSAKVEATKAAIKLLRGGKGTYMTGLSKYLDDNKDNMNINFSEEAFNAFINSVS